MDIIKRGKKKRTIREFRFRYYNRKLDKVFWFQRVNIKQKLVRYIEYINCGNHIDSEYRYEWRDR